MINFANISFNQKENKNIEEREKENKKKDLKIWLRILRSSKIKRFVFD